MDINEAVETTVWFDPDRPAETSIGVEKLRPCPIR